MRSLWLAFVLGLVASGAVVGQGRPGAGPSFLIVRFSSQASYTFYGGYQAGPVVAFAGLVQHPRSGYREALLGVGTNVRWSTGDMLVAVAAADASDAQYAQLYFVPTARLGRAELSGTLEYYEPLEREGARQFYTTPLNLFLVLGERLAVGLTYLVSAQVGIPDGHTIGPSLRIGIPRGSLRFDVMRPVRVNPGEVRVTLTTAF